MCGRFNLRVTPAELAAGFELLRSIETPERYNIAPTQTVIAIRSENGTRVASGLQWGLVPSWAKDAKMGASLINARGETVATKPSFRSAFKRRRCLIPATGFYEWQKTGSKTKQPYHISLLDPGPFAFAGIWESWSGGGEPLETCSIITTEANELMRPLHDRMPVILNRDDYSTWLSEAPSPETLQALIAPFASQEMQAVPITTFVNNPRHEGPACIEPQK